MTDQRRVQCGRANDHEAHTWLSQPDKWCPGKVAPIAGQTSVMEQETRTPPDFARCASTSGSSRCALVVGHEEKGLNHANDVGDTWPAHVPAPGGTFQQLMEDAEEDEDVPTLGVIAREMEKWRAKGVVLGAVIYVACQKVWDDDPDSIAYALLRDNDAKQAPAPRKHEAHPATMIGRR